MHTTTLKCLGRSFARIARLVLFTFASRPRHANWPLLEAKKRE
ncbi:MAG: hypothetical protein JWP59_2878 [Massilia sp.]|nr:hypothetical protein [Massilia sp.]